MEIELAHKALDRVKTQKDTTLEDYHSKVERLETWGILKLFPNTMLMYEELKEKVDSVKQDRTTDTSKSVQKYIDPILKINRTLSPAEKIYLFDKVYAKFWEDKHKELQNHLDEVAEKNKGQLTPYQQSMYIKKEEAIPLMRQKAKEWYDEKKYYRYQFLVAGLAFGGADEIYRRDMIFAVWKDYKPEDRVIFDPESFTFIIWETTKTGRTGKTFTVTDPIAREELKRLMAYRQKHRQRRLFIGERNTKVKDKPNPLKWWSTGFPKAMELAVGKKVTWQMWRTIVSQDMKANQCDHLEKTHELWYVKNVK